MLVSGSFLSSTISPKDAISYLDKYVDLMHVDVMDGKFVENKTYTSGEVIKLSKYITKPLDIHLMVKNPIKYIDELAMLNVNNITFHYEAVKNVMEVINHIKSMGIRCGLAINPETNVSEITEFLPLIDVILVISVHPGKSGQKFIESVTYKIDVLRKLIDENNFSCKISVDGGVNEENIDMLKEKKVDILVSSSYLLNGETLKKVKYMKGV